MNQPIDINSADRKTLAALPGIGATLADRIVQYREKVRPFTEVIELTAVPGISEGKVRAIQAHLSLETPPEEDETGWPEEGSEEEAPSTEILAEERTVSPAAEIPDTEISPDMAEEVVERMPDDVPPAPTAGEGWPGETTTTSTAALDRAGTMPPSAPAMGGPDFSVHIFTAVAGALAGMFLTLALLWLLNGTLRLNESAQVDTLEQQSAAAAATVQADQTGIQGRLERLGGQFSDMTARERETSALLATIEASLEEMEGEIAATAGDITALETDTEELGEQITTITVSAEKFDALLNGLRDLLWALQGPPITATLTIPAPDTTATPMPGAEGTATPGAMPTPTPSRLATRTPRPTATPLG